MVGDAHCEDVRLAVALDRFRVEGVDAVLAVGDLVDGTGDANRTCALLRDAGAVVVAGNHERWLLGGSFRGEPEATPIEALDPSHLTWLSSLPREIEIETAAGRALLCHGLGPHDMAQVRPDDHGYGLAVNGELWSLVGTKRYALVVNGHTHERMVRRFEDTIIVNAGTLRRSRGGVVVVDLGSREARFLGFDGDATLSLVEARSLAEPDLRRETRPRGA